MTTGYYQDKISYKVTVRKNRLWSRITSYRQRKHYKNPCYEKRKLFQTVLKDIKKEVLKIDKEDPTYR